MYKIASSCNYFFHFFQNNEIRFVENSLGLKKIMLANGADNSAVYSFQTLRTFFSKLFKTFSKLAVYW